MRGASQSKHPRSFPRNPAPHAAAQTHEYVKRRILGVQQMRPSPFARSKRLAQPLMHPFPGIDFGIYPGSRKQP